MRVRPFLHLATSAAVVQLAAFAFAQDKPAAPSAKPSAPATKPAGITKPEGKPEGKETPPTGEEAAAMQAAMPGPMNERMMKFAGEWSVETTMEMGEQPPSKSSGTYKISTALGGRFVQETGVGEFMGGPVNSFKMWGYNNGSHKFEAVWAWTMATGFLHMSGESKDDGKSIDWQCWYDNESGAREEFKAKHTFADDDHFTVKLYGGKMPDGSPGPTMTSTYTRKK
ncbi:MAG: DUF1579 family protein [Phycisphaerae bacterium]